MADPQEKLQPTNEGVHADTSAAFDVEESAAREAYSSGSGTYLYGEFRNRAVALQLPKERLGRLKRAWENLLRDRQEGIAPVQEPPKPEEEPQEDEPIDEPAEEEEAAEWTTFQPSGDVVLPRSSQFDQARAFAKHKLRLLSRVGKQPTLGTYFWRDLWWRWNGAFYEQTPRQRIIDEVAEYMDKAKAKNNEEGTVKFNPKAKDISNLISFLQTACRLDREVTPPRWLDDRPSPKPEELLAFRNCLVDVTTGKTYDHEPWLWMQDGVDFDYNPAAKAPNWENFLQRQLFPADEESWNAIEEFVGLCMTLDNRCEKAGLWIGPPRSGRGTIAYIIELLVGPNGYTSLNFHTWHKNENSRMGMIGKRVGIFHDVRLKAGKHYGQNYDPGGVDAESQQLLLEFVSGDASEIGQKYLSAWKGKPTIKLLVISNKPLNFNDEVLSTRFNTVEFTHSFLGRENPDLKNRILPSEVPGIATKCVAAYGHLLRRGHLIQPKTGLALINRVKATVDPWAVFMDAYWEPDPTGEGTLIPVFIAAFRYWCLSVKAFDIIGYSKSAIVQHIKRNPDWRWLKSFRPTGAYHSRQRRYRLKLKLGVELPADVLNATSDDDECDA
jgi:putative DNA primase/helicase